MQNNVVYRGTGYNTEEYAHREVVRKVVTLSYRGQTITKVVEVYK